MRRILRHAAVPVAVLLLAVPSAAQYPDEPGTGVADLAGVLTAADEEAVRGTLDRLRTEAGVEVRVLTVQSVDGFRTGAATPEAFATGVYNAWRLGYGQRQDGVLVLLSVDDRFTRIELGDGVAPDKDAQVRAIVDDVMLPRFRDGDMSGGVRAGVAAVGRAFGVADAAPLTPESPYDPAADASAQPPSAQPAYGAPYGPARGTSSRRSTPSNAPLSSDAGPILMLLLAIGGVLTLVLVAKGRKRKCPQCRMEMQALDESADDVYLDSGRRMEEVLGSVDYTVYRCPGCGLHDIRRSSRWFSGRQSCPQCSYRTVSVDRETLHWPTYDEGGLARVQKDCAHCHWHDVDMIHLPRKPRPAPTSSRSSSSWSSGSGSSSSRGSGGGSSGGSSSGRGSSGRW